VVGGGWGDAMGGGGVGGVGGGGGGGGYDSKASRSFWGLKYEVELPNDMNPSDRLAYDIYKEPGKYLVRDSGDDGCFDLELVVPVASKSLSLKFQEEENIHLALPEICIAFSTFCKDNMMTKDLHSIISSSYALANLKNLTQKNIIRPD